MPPAVGGTNRGHFATPALRSLESPADAVSRKMYPQWIRNKCHVTNNLGT